MDSRQSLLAQIAEDCGPEIDATGTISHLENFEASEWLTAKDAPKDAAIQLLLDGLCELQGTDAQRMNLLLVRLLCEVSFDNVGELRDMVRALITDGCRAEIGRELRNYDVTELASLATVKRADECMFHVRQAG